MEKLIELINHVDFIVVGNPATQLAQLSDLEDKVLLNLIKLRPDELESVEVPLGLVLLQIDHFLLQLIKLLQNHSHLDHN